MEGPNFSEGYVSLDYKNMGERYATSMFETSKLLNPLSEWGTYIPLYGQRKLFDNGWKQTDHVWNGGDYKVSIKGHDKPSSSSVGYGANAGPLAGGFCVPIQEGVRVTVTAEGMPVVEYPPNTLTGEKCVFR